MGSQANLKALGLNYSPNNLALPEGSLVIADDVIIRRDNVVESRRGFREYSEVPTGQENTRSSQLMIYKGRLINHYFTDPGNIGILSYEDGTFINEKAQFSNFSGDYQETEPGLRIKSIQANKNLYFTTNEGIKKLAATSAENIGSSPIIDSGAVKAINFKTELDFVQGQSSGFLGFDSAVAYRIIWGYKDVNENLILGAPSDSSSVYNYLKSVCSLDINALCLALDNIKQNSASFYSAIHNVTTNVAGETFTGTFTNSFKTNLSDTADILKSNLISIATNIDRFSLLADINAVANDKPLQITTFEITATECIITFSNDPSTVFSVGDKIEVLGASAPFNVINNPNSNESKYYELLSVTATQIKFAFKTDPATTPVAPASPGATTQIFSYNYRNIINTAQNDVTSSNFTELPSSLVNLETTNDNNQTYATIESNVYAIINKLKLEKAAVISSNLQQTFITPLNVTSAANVKLTINIPEAVKDLKTVGIEYFFQIYRTSNIIAEPTEILGVDILPDEEMNLVYEAFPTDNELNALEAIVLDSYPDDLRGFQTPLYTNPASGEGLSQSNEPPPIAKDINSFKGYVFYANTKTRHRLNPFTLLGTSNIENNDTLLITDGTNIGTTQYTFVEGSSEKTKFTFALSLTPWTDVANKHFTVFTADDEKEYFVWYRLDNKNISSVSVVGDEATFTTTDNHNLSNGQAIQLINTTVGLDQDDINGLYEIEYIDPTNFKIQVPSGTTIGVANASFIPYYTDKIVLIVDVLNGDSAQNIRDKTINAINSKPFDFISGTGTLYTTSQFYIKNTKEGLTTTANAGDFAVGSLLTITIENNGTGQDASNNQVLLSRADSRAQAIDLTARSLVTVINQNQDSPVIAYYTSSSTTLPGIISLESKTLKDEIFYILGSDSGVGISFNPDIGPMNSPDQTSSAYIKYIVPGVGISTITTNVAHNLSNGDKIIILNTSTANIEGMYTVSNAVGTTFTIPVVASKSLTQWATAQSYSINQLVLENNVFYKCLITHTSTTFATDLAAGKWEALESFGAWSKLSDTVGSTNETKPNRVYYSKLLRPEAVPVANAIDVGSSDKKILRIFPLRDSLFVFKEDGLFRISGESEPFVRSLFDTSCVLIAPDSVSVANNIIYAWTNKGISNITEAGVTEISRPIDTVILKLASSSYPNFSKLTWGVGYDSDNSYTVYTNSTQDDEYATVGFRFSNLTNTWTNFKRSQTCGLIRSEDDKIYTGSGVYNLIEQERKNFNRTDYADKDFYITVDDGKIQNDGKTLLTFDIDGIKAGDVIVQEQILTIYVFNSLLQKLDIDPSSQKGYETALKKSSGVNLLTAVNQLAVRLDSEPTWPNGYVAAITGLTDATVAFNVIINLLNGVSSGTTFKNYKEATEIKYFEAVVDSVNKTNNQINLNLGLQFVVGEFRAYKSIPCEIQYAPATFGDPLTIKQIYEATMMFSSKAFTRATAEFSSDLKPEFFPIEFYGQGNGIFGSYSEPGFGFGFFGGGSNAAPFRTIIPRESQRCRFINVKFSHNVAREIWSLYGITLTGNATQSTRGYR